MFLGCNFRQLFSTFFVNPNKTALYKLMFSIRTMIAAGMALAFLLPRQIGAFLAAAMTVPQLTLTLTRHQDPFEKHAQLYAEVMREKLMEISMYIHLTDLILSGISHTDVLESFYEMLGKWESDPERYEFLGAREYISANPLMDSSMAIMYWRSQEYLDAYARDHMSKHLLAMKWSSRVVKDSSHF